MAPDQTVYEALEKMAEHDIGALLVLSNHRLVGILSERDYARKGILMGQSSKETQVRPDHDQPGGLRESPAHRGRVHGHYDPAPFSPSAGRCRTTRWLESVSIGDLVKWVISGQAQTIQELQGYITGAYPG